MAPEVRWAIREARVRSVYLQRVPLLGIAVLAAFPLLAMSFGRSMLRNLFELSLWSAALIGAMAMIAAWVCGALGKLAAAYGERRVRDASISLLVVQDLDDWRRVTRRSSWAALPTILAIAAESPGDVVAAIIATLILLLLVSFRVATRPAEWGRRLQRTPAARRLAEFLSRQPVTLSAGYVGHDEAGRPLLLLGHLVAGVLFLIVAGVYVLLGFLGWPGGPLALEIPALAYLLVLLTLLVSLFAGIAFFFDRYRVPTLLLAVVWVALALVSNGPHTFVLKPLAAGSAGASEQGPVLLPSPERVLQNRISPGAEAVDDDTVVVVCASGGGIHAAVWTASVLSWLQAEPELGQGFTRSIRLVSGTSGGSVGLMYFLAGYQSDAGAPPEAALDRIPRRAGRSSLSEVAWGLAYPDFLRAFVPFLVPTSLSRTTAMEDAWAQPLDKRFVHAAGNAQEDAADDRIDSRWADWVEKTTSGELPGIVFNAFDTLSGDRVLLSTVDHSNAQAAMGLEDLVVSETPSAGAVLRADVDVVTAARLSATFPYITPISRPRLSSSPGDLAVYPAAIADGGYFDNSGIIAALEWIRAVKASNGFRSNGVRRVVLVEIRAFARDQSGEAPDPSWLASILRPLRDGAAGPLAGLTAMRTTSQVARAEAEIALLRDALGGDPEIRHVVFDPGSSEWPLSWHLSTTEFETLREQGRWAFERALPALLDALEIDGSTDGDAP